MSGEYAKCNDNRHEWGTPSKEIEQMIFKNMMKTMLKEFNC